MSTLHRTEIVRPGMCGHNSLFVGQIGDWTWDAVSASCGVDVLRARDRAGHPAYLSFYYYRVRGSRRFHLRSPTFGDRLHVSSRLFGYGSESVLTVHRIRRAADGDPEPIEPEEFFSYRDERSLYVENFNRWVSRGGAEGNEALAKASPPDFQHSHLPVLPERYSPRRAYDSARKDLTFLGGAAPAPAAELTVEYEVDPSRDLNGAGLLYFASYFSIVDWALLRLWRALGRADQSFLDRVVVDQQICYLGNADAGRALQVRLRDRGRTGPGGREVVDVVLRERDCGRLLAVCTLQLLTGESP